MDEEKRFKLESDESGHWYIFPVSMQEKFDRLSLEGSRTDDWSPFIKAFQQYMLDAGPTFISFTNWEYL